MVEIIPKLSEKEDTSPSFLFFFSVFFLVAALIAYLVFFSLQKKAEGSIQNLYQKLSKEKTADIEALENRLKKYEIKIKDIEPLLAEHIFASKFFGELEKNTHPLIFFYSLDLDLVNFTATLKGKSSDFFTLGQQVLILEKNPLISAPTIEQVNIDKEGWVDFLLKFNFNPQLIRF